MISTLPGLHNMKPGFAGKPLPGISAKNLMKTNRSYQGVGYLI